MRRRGAHALAVAAVLSATIAVQPAGAGFFDFLFGTPDDVAGHAARPAAPQPGASATHDDQALRAPTPPIGGAPRSSSGHCVRLCDGMHFPVHGKGGMSPAAMCQAFCPASVTKVFFGNQIDRATAADGERYADLDNAFAYRKKLSGSCTCNGREPVGLVPVDIALDGTLRSGDVVATTAGLVAFSGIRSGAPGSDFTPVATYTGIGAAARAQLTELKVAPVHAEVNEDITASIDATRTFDAAKPRASLD